MSLHPRRTHWFDADFQFRTTWYARQGGIELASRFINAVEATVRKLAENPERGRRPFRKDPELTEIHCVLVDRPFRKHVLHNVVIPASKLSGVHR
jgi:plasmid stabilization system protein ParE